MSKSSLKTEILYLYNASVVQWIECQIPVLMMGVRIPSGAQNMSLQRNKVAGQDFIYSLFEIQGNCSLSKKTKSFNPGED